MRSLIILSLALFAGCVAATQSTPTTSQPPIAGCHAMGWLPISALLTSTRDPVQRIVRIEQNFRLRSCRNFSMGVREDVTRDLGEACGYGQLECFVACHGLDPSVRRLYVGQCQEHWDIRLNLN